MLALFVLVSPSLFQTRLLGCGILVARVILLKGSLSPIALNIRYCGDEIGFPIEDSSDFSE